MRQAKVTTPLWKVQPLPQWGPTNPDHQWLTHRHGNHIPAVLTEPQPFDDAFPRPATQWRTAIYRHLTEDPTPSFWIHRTTPYEFADVIEPIYQLAPPHTPTRVYKALKTFYTRLLASGLLDQKGDDTMPIRVVHLNTQGEPDPNGRETAYNPECDTCGTTWEAQNTWLPTSGDQVQETGWDLDEDDGTAKCPDCIYLEDDDRMDRRHNYV